MLNEPPDQRGSSRILTGCSLDGEARSKPNSQIGEQMKGAGMIAPISRFKFPVENQICIWLCHIYTAIAKPTGGRREIQLRFVRHVGSKYVRSSSK